jgi:hypothetical protein
MLSSPYTSLTLQKLVGSSTKLPVTQITHAVSAFRYTMAPMTETISVSDECTSMLVTEGTPDEFPAAFCSKPYPKASIIKQTIDHT